MNNDEQISNPEKINELNENREDVLLVSNVDQLNEEQVNVKLNQRKYFTHTEQRIFLDAYYHVDVVYVLNCFCHFDEVHQRIMFA